MYVLFLNRSGPAGSFSGTNITMMSYFFWTCTTQLPLTPRCPWWMHVLCLHFTKSPSFFQLYPSGVILNTKRKLCTVEPRYSEGPMDWQNLFAISRFCYIELHYNYWGSTISVLPLGYVIHPLSSVYSHYIVAVDSLFFEKIVFCDLLFLQRKLVSPSLWINMKNTLFCFEHVAAMRKPIHHVIGKITSLGMWHSL